VALARSHIRAGKDNVLTDLKRRQEMREWQGTETIN
jgi:hypothetical protein